ncbi:MAG: SdhA [Holophagaceae bacterium]|uniref:FAD-dependent oxidoreductase n=1 Tax=Holophaga foetida TaxID=35839 RepID=UPI0002472172|nr:FAD-binding protein [Holophaga foetida]MBP1627655.1 SdhA [Holophagaceae bacterium]
MNSIEHFGKVISTDILIVGHGISGLSAAITAKEKNPALKVLAVDKACVGFGGKANKGGGHISYIPEGAEETYVEYHTRNLGDYLNNQDRLRRYAHSTVKTLDKWESWGVSFRARDDAFQAHPIIPWKMFVVDLDMLIPMAKHARQAGVEFMEKVAIVDLLTDGDQVCGAIGFDLVTAEILVFKAKAVVLANGNQNWRVMRMWSSSRGEGIATAWRAGARMRGAEFGSFVNMISVEHFQVSYGSENAMFNAKGEFMDDRADLDGNLKDTFGGADLGGTQSISMYKQVAAGNGPIFEDTEKNDYPSTPQGMNIVPEVGRAADNWFRPFAHKWWHLLWEKNKMGGYKTSSKMKEVAPGFIGEFGPVNVDDNWMTNIKGLFASGDICAGGIQIFGAVPAPPGRNRGSGLIAAVYHGIHAGPAAADYVTGLEKPGQIDPVQLQALQEDMLVPLYRSQGVTAAELTWKIQCIMTPVPNSALKREDRLKAALAETLALKAELPKLVASDGHSLSACIETKAMVLCAEMFFRASLERKETRGWHIREDFPSRDDSANPYWVDLENVGGEMAVSRTEVPLNHYVYQPG